jgi:NhaP-type Na+/H+ or K+/H+ antiporter
MLLLLLLLQVFGEGVVNDAVSVVLLGAVAAATHAHDSGGEAAGSQHRLAGGIVANFVWLLVTSLLLGGAAGLGIAVLLRRLRLQGAHQVGLVLLLGKHRTTTNPHTMCCCDTILQGVGCSCD